MRDFQSSLKSITRKATRPSSLKKSKKDNTKTFLTVMATSTITTINSNISTLMFRGRANHGAIKYIKIIAGSKGNTLITITASSHITDRINTE